MKSTRPTRRTFLLGSLATSAVLCSRSSSWAAPASAPIAAAPGEDLSSRKTFDALDLAWNDGNGATGQNNESGALGWGEAYALQSYVLMYQAHSDTVYLDKLIDHADRVLTMRDSVRGVRDYRGLSLPAWRTAGKYTCGIVDLKDANGNLTLRLRTAYRPSGQVNVAVATGAKAGTFRLTCKTPKLTDVYDNLTMDRGSEHYAIRRIAEQFEPINGTDAGERTMITGVALASSPPAPTKTAIAFMPQPYIYAVQTGMITWPLAAFVRVVRGTPALADRYKAKADEYAAAVVDAVKIFDYEFREEASRGEGWLVWARGAPIPFDGSDQPHNQYLALGCAMIELASATGDDALRRRATMMARTFKNDLKLGANGAYSWTYFWTKGKAYNGWSVKDDVSDYQPSFVHGNTRGHKAIEDTSHAHIDIAFALLAYVNKLGVFDETDMRRLATTFTKNILTRDEDGQPAIAEHVDGSGKKGMYQNMAAAWSGLAAFDPSIVPALRELYRTRSPAGNPQGFLFASALMNYAAS